MSFHYGRILVTSSLIAGGFIVMGEGIAQAHACSTSYSRICIFDNANFQGEQHYSQHNATTRSVIVWDLPSEGFNDAMSSYFNASTSRDAKWFHETGLRGTGRCMPANHAETYVGWYDNDEASSVAKYNNNSVC